MTGGNVASIILVTALGLAIVIAAAIALLVTYDFVAGCAHGLAPKGGGTDGLSGAERALAMREARELSLHGPFGDVADEESEGGGMVVHLICAACIVAGGAWFAAAPSGNGDILVSRSVVQRDAIRRHGEMLYGPYRLMALNPFPADRSAAFTLVYGDGHFEASVIGRGDLVVSGETIVLDGNVSVVGARSTGVSPADRLPWAGLLGSLIMTDAAREGGILNITSVADKVTAGFPVVRLPDEIVSGLSWTWSADVERTGGGFVIRYAGLSAQQAASLALAVFGVALLIGRLTS